MNKKRGYPNCNIQAITIEKDMRKRGKVELLAAYDALDPNDREIIADCIIKLCSYIKGFGPSSALELLSKMGIVFCKEKKK